ncbi:hypothetical protein AAKU67_000698 [Oxalobacteraceae bacterium GrIS 2.11]
MVDPTAVKTLFSRFRAVENQSKQGNVATMYCNLVVSKYQKVCCAWVCCRVFTGLPTSLFFVGAANNDNSEREFRKLNSKIKEICNVHSFKGNVYFDDKICHRA